MSKFASFTDPLLTQSAAIVNNDAMTASPMDRVLMMRGHWSTERTLHRAMQWNRTLGR